MNCLVDPRESPGVLDHGFAVAESGPGHVFIHVRKTYCDFRSSQRLRKILFEGENTKIIIKAYLGRKTVF